MRNESLKKIINKDILNESELNEIIDKEEI
jgi:hypothetical protein